MEYIIFATVLNSHKMESKEYFEKVMQDHNQNRKERSLVSIAKMKQWIMTGSSSTRRTILYRRNTRNHRKMLSYKLSQLLDKVIERCFRHIAMGRRNWLQTGSHFSAQNLGWSCLYICLCWSTYRKQGWQDWYEEPCTHSNEEDGDERYRGTFKWAHSELYFN